jgi:hypothetical protein
MQQRVFWSASPATGSPAPAGRRGTSVRATSGNSGGGIAVRESGEAKAERYAEKANADSAGKHSGATVEFVARQLLERSTAVERPAVPAPTG